MARNKLITIRIEGEKREAFNNLAKSQNTDTASVLYDFISGCLDGKIDIGIVTGKKQWIDKIDNQLDSNRLDKLEATTQEIDKRLGNLSKKVTDWVIAFDDCLNDCDRELSEKINNLEHRLNALASQLDSQQDRQQIDSIDIDSQLDRQRETPDMGTVVTVEAVYTVETADTVEPDSINKPVKDSIEGSEKKIVDSLDILIGSIDGTVESVEPNSSIETVASAIESVTDSKPWYTIDELLDCHYPGWPKTKEGLRKKALTECWPRRTQRGSKGNPYEYQAVLPE